MTMPQVCTSSRMEAPADRSLQRLAGAVLIQALQDASSGPRRFREEALEWINGKATAGFTFDFCCALLNRDPEDVRERLRKHNFIPKWDPGSEMGSSFGASYSGGFATARQSFGVKAS